MADAESKPPLLVYDGACGFCKRWVARWSHSTFERVAYAPFQEVAGSHPGIPEAAFAEAVHLIEPDGSHFRGAEAVFRALATDPRRAGWLWAYRRVPGFSALSEACYRVVAGNRPFFTRVTDALWGKHLTPPGERVTVLLYLRLLAIVYAVAFLSLGSQVIGLVGSHGILPASATLETLRSAPNLGLVRYWLAPTLCWLASGDWFLMALCVAGAVLAVSLALGFAPVPCLIGLWAAYLSLATVCREFLWFQWDGLLLEAGFLACFLASPAPRGALRLARWLLFRLLVASAAVKLAGGDASWSGLTALRHHYETQPLPPWTAWYAHHLPPAFQSFSTGATLFVEGIVPFLFFAPRRLRFAGAAAVAVHQLVIAATGNYGFFNLITLALCVLLLDDGVWPRFLGERFAIAANPAPEPRPRAAWVRRTVLVGLFLLSLVPFLGAFRAPSSWLGPLGKAYELMAPIRTVNYYGLFAVMTKERPEILVEGSADGVTWKVYEFRYKPGDLTRKPCFVAPHQPRLDWQMWFAALSDARTQFWFLRFCEELLRNSKPVVDLLQANPFPDTAPRYVRAILYRYHFTTAAERRATGAWWRREPVTPYCPVLTLEGGQLVVAPRELQRW